MHFNFKNMEHILELTDLSCNELVVIDGEHQGLAYQLGRLLAEFSGSIIDIF
jgi:hypothetical protein